MKNKTILIYVKNNEALENYIRMIKNGEYDDKIPYSREVRKMIEEFSENEWKVFLGTIDNFDTKNGIYNQIYSVYEDKLKDMSIDEINRDISFMIIRNLGSVELNFNKIQNCLKYLIEHYKGKVLNNPKAMLKGMTKHYLVEIDPEELEEYGVSRFHGIYNIFYIFKTLLQGYIVFLTHVY